MAITISGLANNLLLTYSAAKNAASKNVNVSENTVSKTDYNVTDFSEALTKFKTENPTTLDNFFGGGSTSDSDSFNIYSVASDLLAYSKNYVTASKLGLNTSSNFNIYGVSSAQSYAQNLYSTYLLNKKLSQMSYYSNISFSTSSTSTVSGSTLDTNA